MPLSFEAFRTMHHTDYLTYARACLSSHRADEAVEQTFNTLSDNWRAVLGSASPAHTAWELLNEHLHSNEGEPCCPTGAIREELRMLATLGYSPDRIAALTGHPLGKVRSATQRRARPRHPMPQATPIPPGRSNP